MLLLVVHIVSWLQLEWELQQESEQESEQEPEQEPRSRPPCNSPISCHCRCCWMRRNTIPHQGHCQDCSNSCYSSHQNSYLSTIVCIHILLLSGVLLVAVLADGVPALKGPHHQLGEEEGDRFHPFQVQCIQMTLHTLPFGIFHSDPNLSHRS